MNNFWLGFTEMFNNKNLGAMIAITIIGIGYMLACVLTVLYIGKCIDNNSNKGEKQ